MARQEPFNESQPKNLLCSAKVTCPLSSSQAWWCWAMALQGRRNLQALWGSRETKNIRPSYCPQDSGWYYLFVNIIKNRGQKKIKCSFGSSKKLKYVVLEATEEVYKLISHASLHWHFCFVWPYFSPSGSSSAFMISQASSPTKFRPGVNTSCVSTSAVISFTCITLSNLLHRWRPGFSSVFTSTVSGTQYIPIEWVNLSNHHIGQE